MRRTLLEREPRTPSARLYTLSGEELARTAKHRRVPAPELASQLRGDLDWIVMKALEKDRSRRYETAHDLAMDIRRYLENEPVLARPPARWYLLQKLVRRNRRVFVAGAAVAVALLIGAVTSTWLYLQERAAERRAASAQREVDSRREEEIAGRVAQAESSVARSDFVGADKLLDGITLENPSTNAAAMLRKLGDWDAENGRWPQAAARFKQLALVDREDGLDAVMLDHLRLGPALVSSGQINDYERFRQEMLDRYGGSASDDCDLIIKFCLLLPANHQFVEKILPQAEYSERLLKESLASPKRNSNEAWAPLALGLFEYRHGNEAKAAEWCRQCVAFPEYDAARSAAAEAILAMSCWQMKQKEDALLALKQAQDMMAGKFQPGPGVEIGPKYNWFDGEFAGILIREGEEHFAKADPSLAGISQFEPGVERAAVLRAQGELHAARQEWREAADSFEALLGINQRDDWNVATQDFLACGALLAELGDDASYYRVRNEAVARFSGTENRAAAERILRICLLRPVDGKLMAALAPMADRVVRPFGRDEEKLSQDRSYSAWHAVTMLFLAGRHLDFVKCADWSRRAIDSEGDLPFPAAIGYSALAMSLYQLGQDDAARLELEKARDLVENRLKKELDQSSWCDWLCGDVMLREATILLSGPDQRKKPNTK
jgi:tetratricopeptide (TPR) repeat protein